MNSRTPLKNDGDARGALLITLLIVVLVVITLPK